VSPVGSLGDFGMLSDPGSEKDLLPPDDNDITEINKMI
jgi:hypothetical protein